MVKFRMYYDEEREVAWLNEMSTKGYALSDYCMGLYSFKKCPPGEYVYQIDMMNRFFDVDDDYKEFMEDTGVELVCMWGFWVILRKKAADGPFQLYTDVESRIEHYSKIKLLFKVAAILEIICLMTVLFEATQGSLAALSFSFVIMALIALMLRQVMRVNKILAELKGRIGETMGFAIGKKRQLSGFIIWGLLFQSIGFLLKGWGFPYGEVVIEMIHGLAYAFMIIGFICTLWKCKQ